jgi:hypothetical protein
MTFVEALEESESTRERVARLPSEEGQPYTVVAALVMSALARSA